MEYKTGYKVVEISGRDGTMWSLTARDITYGKHWTYGDRGPLFVFPRREDAVWFMPSPHWRRREMKIIEITYVPIVPKRTHILSVARLSSGSYWGGKGSEWITMSAPHGTAFAAAVHQGHWPPDPDKEQLNKIFSLYSTEYQT